MTRWLTLGSLACLTLTGCVPDLSPWEVERDPSIRLDGGGPSGERCTRTVDADTISPSSSGCVFDERITSGPGQLEYDCAGGSATITFGDHVFAGTFAGGDVDVVLTSRYMYSACEWVTEQRISGSVASGRLGYTYDEAPAPGQSGCASACRGWADVDVR